MTVYKDIFMKLLRVLFNNGIELFWTKAFQMYV